MAGRNSGEADSVKQKLRRLLPDLFERCPERTQLQVRSRKMDASEYGGALLLGVRAPFIICHGSSKAKAIKNAVRVAIELTEKDIVGKIGREILRDEESGEL